MCVCVFVSVYVCGCVSVLLHARAYMHARVCFCVYVLPGSPNLKEPGLNLISFIAILIPHHVPQFALHNVVTVQLLKLVPNIARGHKLVPF